MVEIEISIIEKAKEECLKGNKLDKKSVISLLEIDPFSSEAEILGDAAREVSQIITDNKGKIWASIGVDYKKCSMNCDFCAFGDKWGIIKNEQEKNLQELVELAQIYVSEGASWITLRTTQFYGINKLLELIKNIRFHVKGNYQIVVNTGEFDEVNANLLKQAGANTVYHTVRLREGINTQFDPNQRIETLKSISKSCLNLAYLVEPVGNEHTSEEIADSFFIGMEYNASISGAMARVPLPGTPFSEYLPLSERRLAQIVAVTRLAAGFSAPDICVHPPSQLSLNWGANVLVVETGAIPRNTDNCECEWNNFGIKDAFNFLHNAGYK